MPQVVLEGRRTVNNIERSASLFLVKIYFSSACIPVGCICRAISSASDTGYVIKCIYDRNTGIFSGT